MSDEFIDPLNDPRFPDRPNTPEFWRLVEIGLAHDATSVETRGTQSVINGMVDEKTLIYYARHRLGTAFGDELKTLTPRQQVLMLAVYLDAFAKGYAYAKSPEATPKKRSREEPRYALGIRWDYDAMEWDAVTIGHWWVDVDDRKTGVGHSEAVLTKSDAISRITSLQQEYPDHDLFLPGLLSDFIEAADRPEGLDRSTEDDDA